jgi:large subunit ribosomal protein L6
MRRQLFREIKVPEGIEFKINGNEIVVSGQEGKIVKNFELGRVNLTISGDKIKIGNEKSTKKEKKIMNTMNAHIKNMIKGVNEKYEYKLKVCSSHFPIGVELNGRNVIVKNFLGEKIPRKTTLPENVEVKIDRDIITVKSCDKEIAGIAAAKFEMVTKIRDRDRRIFQDGIFMITKAGRAI